MTNRPAYPIDLREEIKQVRSNNQSIASLLEPAAIDELLALVDQECERRVIEALFQEHSTARVVAELNWILYQTEIDDGSSKVAYMNNLRQAILKRKHAIESNTKEETQDGTVTNQVDDISLCGGCNCMTHTVGEKCGKCGHNKDSVTTASPSQDPASNTTDSSWIDELLREFREAVEFARSGGGIDLDEIQERAKAAIEKRLKEAEIKLLKDIRRYYPKKNGRANDTSKLTRAELDRMIGERIALQKEKPMSSEDNPPICVNCEEAETQYNKVLPTSINGIFLLVCTRCRSKL